MLSSYNLKNKQTIQISGLILQYCSATTLYRRLATRIFKFDLEIAEIIEVKVGHHHSVIICYLYSDSHS